MSERVRDQDLPQRLRRLEELLAQSITTSNTGGDGPADPEEVYLHSVPTERIRRLTAELGFRADGDIDALDATAMRLLLNDYRAAVTHLRAVARAAGARLSAVAGPIKEARALVSQEQKPVASDQLDDTTPGPGASV